MRCLTRACDAGRGSGEEARTERVFRSERFAILVELARRPSGSTERALERNPTRTETIPVRVLTTQPSRGGVLTAILLALAFMLAGCDNPACIFDPKGCPGSGGSGGTLGSNPAALPSDHNWIQTFAPTMISEFPSGTGVNVQTPIVIVFSESMSSKSLSGAIELVPSGGFSQGVPLLPGASIGDGRMWVLFPLTDLTADTTYDVRFTTSALVTDLTGTALSTPTDNLITTFTTASSAGTPPTLVASWPPANSTNQSSTGEIVMVFDRPLDPASVDTNSFDIKVNGAPPTFDPLPQALVVVSNSIPFSDTRVYRWRSVDNDGVAANLGQSASVQTSLSSTGHKLTFKDFTQLAPTSVTYTTSSFSAPGASEIVSLPTDAIGVAQLSGGNAKVGELEIALTLDDGQPTDAIGVFIFGTQATTPPQLGTFYREFKLSSVPYDSNTHIATIKEAQLDLVKTAVPFEARLADGTLTFAFRRVRGSLSSPVRLLDTDPDTSGPQSPTLDTKPPTLTALDATGVSKTLFRSDMPNFMLVGRASESISRVEVSTALGDNGVLAKVVASSSNGLFIAQPFTQAVFQSPLDPLLGNNPLAFTVVVYDKALNASVPQAASYQQLGGVGVGNTLPGPFISVEVYDATTLLPLANAHVLIHDDFFGVESYIDDGFTDANGSVTLAASDLARTMVTVDVSGYDLLTYFGAPTDEISLPLNRTTPSVGLIEGLLFSGSGAVANFDRNASDTRRAELDEPTVAINSCSVDPISLQLECAFGPYPVLSSRIGALSAVITSTPLSEFNYTAPGFLKGFTFGIPQAPVASAQTQPDDLLLPSLLDDPNTPLESLPIDGPAVTLDASAVVGIDLAHLDSTPRVLLESRSPGMRADPMVGGAVAFDLNGGVYKVRSAYPGVVDPTSGKYPGDEQGTLVQDGTIDPDLMLRCELRDTFGARVGRRPRLSNMPGTVIPLDAATLLVPAPLGNTGGESYDLDFSNVITDAMGEPGIYRVNLVGSNGRRWRIYVVDPDDTFPTVHIRVPDLTLNNGTGLPNGPIGCTIEAFAWPGFQPTLFSFTDLVREYDAFSVSAPVTFSKP